MDSAADADGFMQDNYGCILAPSHAGKTYFGDANGKTTVTYRRNRNVGICPPGLASLSISLGPVTNTAGRLSAAATVTTVEYGIQGVVFAIDGHYVSAVMGPRPYILNYGAAALPTGSHRVTATVVDAVGVLAVGGGQRVSTTRGVGPAGPIAPNVDPGQQDFDIAGNADDPINGGRGGRR
jgi:hypothetical protein